MENEFRTIRDEQQQLCIRKRTIYYKKKKETFDRSKGVRAIY